MEYKTIQEKKVFFQYERIDTLENLQKAIDYLSSKKGCRFRGVNEAKYKMTTSLQRECNKYKIESSVFFESLLKIVRQNSNVQQFFKRKNIIINDISCLSLMQHYALPTPFIDFTVDVCTAVSFALDGLSIVESECDIENYASLIYFDLDEERELCETIMQNVFSDGLDSKAMLQEYTKMQYQSYLDCSDVEKIDRYTKWSGMKDIDFIFIEYDKKAITVRTLCGEILNIANPNQEKQSGCFFVSNDKKNIPLENNWNRRTDVWRNNFWTKENKNKLPYSGIYTKNNLHCIDIKKSVLSEWGKMNRYELYDNSEESNIIRNTLCQLYDDFICQYMK